jgi:murein DD-endopeptidase MepM/ murein hydrolase activator NlpD
MQLMWLSGPTGSVKTISITLRTVLAGVSVAAFTLLLLGFLLHFVGFKIAVEYNPALARSMGGVTTEAEQRKMEAIYREDLDKMRDSLQATIGELKQLEAMKNHFMEIATPTNLRDKWSHNKDDSRGGPFVTPRVISSFIRLPLGQELDNTLTDMNQTELALKEIHAKWDQQLEWLSTLPTGIPVQGDFRLTSGFGIRNDPFSGALAMHEGLDFAANVGTPVVSTGPGTVVRSNWDASYGNVIEVSHLEGFVTRYAHLSKRVVAEGDKVTKGELIGEIGTTGRSTGPHLHYEVFRKDHLINPVQVLPFGPAG